MQYSPTDIKERLLRGLDEEYNVVDMGVVVEVISILEKIPITKEALEATRLGKCINLLRKKTNNVSLAKRAKNLVKRWRDLVDLTGASQQNGAGVERTNAVTLEPLVESVPRTHAANKRLRKSYEGEGGDNYEPLKKKSRVNGLTRCEAVIAEADAGECSRGNIDKNDSAFKKSVPVELIKPPEVPDELISVPDPPPGPKKRGRKKGSKNRSTLMKAAGVTKTNDDIIKEKIASISRTPKVKTTQELVAALGSKAGDTLELGSKSVPTSERSSSLINSVLSRTEVDQGLSKSRVDYHNKYLNEENEFEKRRIKEEIKAISKEDDDASGSPINVLDNSLEETSPAVEDTIANPLPPEEPPPIPAPIQPAELNTVEEILSQLPPFDADAIVWDETPVPSPMENPSVTPEDLDRLHEEFVEGLNGVWEHSNQPESANSEQTSDTFKEWHQMVHRRSYHNDLLRILPYTVID